MSLKPPKKSDLNKAWIKPRLDKAKKNTARVSSDCYRRDKYGAKLL